MIHIQEQNQKTAALFREEYKKALIELIENRVKEHDGIFHVNYYHACSIGYDGKRWSDNSQKRAAILGPNSFYRFCGFYYLFIDNYFYTRRRFYGENFKTIIENGFKGELKQFIPGNINDMSNEKLLDAFCEDGVYEKIKNFVESPYNYNQYMDELWGRFLAEEGKPYEDINDLEYIVNRIFELEFPEKELKGYRKAMIEAIQEYVKNEGGIVKFNYFDNYYFTDICLFFNMEIYGIYKQKENLLETDEYENTNREKLEFFIDLIENKYIPPPTRGPSGQI
jgi:hypothetical protein